MSKSRHTEAEMIGVLKHGEREGQGMAFEPLASRTAVSKLAAFT